MEGKEKYSFKKYNPKYFELFRREKAKLKNILPPDAKIEHFGSTAIKGLGGKGIIDILISVKKQDVKKARKLLQMRGYNFKPQAGNKERYFFNKIYKYNKSERLIHVHLTFHNSNEIKKDLAITDYLRNHPKKAKEYSLIKKGAVKYAKGEGKKYRKYKKSFLDKIEELVLKEVKEK